MSKRKRKHGASQLPTVTPPRSVQDRQLRTLRMTQLSARMTAGPIPSAEELERYRMVQPDLPERIMQQFERRTDMAEAQSEHRMGLEKRVIGNNILMERLGWFSATLMGLVVLGGSLYLIYAGKSLEGLAGVVLALAALLGLYVWARRDQIQQVSKKRAADMVEQGATPEQLDLLPSGEIR